MSPLTPRQRLVLERCAPTDGLTEAALDELLGDPAPAPDGTGPIRVPLPERVPTRTWNSLTDRGLARWHDHLGGRRLHTTERGLRLLVAHLVVQRDRLATQVPNPGSAWPLSFTFSYPRADPALEAAIAAKGPPCSVVKHLGLERYGWPDGSAVTIVDPVLARLDPATLAEPWVGIQGGIQGGYPPSDVELAAIWIRMEDGGEPMVTSLDRFLGGCEDRDEVEAWARTAAVGDRREFDRGSYSVTIVDDPATVAPALADELAAEDVAWACTAEGCPDPQRAGRRYDHDGKVVPVGDSGVCAPCADRAAARRR